MNLISKSEFKIPILFTIYNRLETTKVVFEAIKKIKPAYLYLASDGPKTDEERIKVEKVREYVISNIDWDVTLKTNFYNQNKGCGRAMSSSVDWFFNNVEMGIILEDDCLPNKSFFKYCEVLLNYHKNNMDVWHISGAVLYKKENYYPSYYYSVYPGMWGWASWSNRWIKYNYDMNEIDINFADYKYFEKSSISKTFFKKIKKRMENFEIDTWDYQWIFTIWKNNGICITPNINLISNIGFDDLATHTKNKNDIRFKQKNDRIDDIKHPSKIEFFNDNLLKTNYFSTPNIFNRLRNKLFK